MKPERRLRRFLALLGNNREIGREPRGNLFAGRVQSPREEFDGSRDFSKVVLLFKHWTGTQSMPFATRRV